MLYDRYGSVAYGLALRVLDDPDLAATAVEDAFAELTRETPPDGVTARSRILTLVRGRAVELRPENAEARSGPGLESSGHVAERARALRALDLLPYDQREVVALAYYDGCTLDEIADRLHQPRETVVRTLRDGLAALQRASNEADQGRPAGADPEPRRPGTLGVSIGAVHAHRGRPRSFPSSDPE